jgi:hypothetical protein
MAFRNAAYLVDGRIDCEYQHPVLGWIPATLSSADPATAALFAAVVAAGGITPAPAAPTAAELLAAERATMVCTKFQAKAALAAIGKLTLADSVVLASGNATIQLAWAEASTFKRNSPSIAALAGALSLSETDLDDLFRAAVLIAA